MRRPAPDGKLLASLHDRTRRLGQAPTTESARAEWRQAKAVRRDVRRLLETAAPGMARCMYCGDSQGTDVDHFEPLKRAPGRAFDWLNHLLACSYCNSNKKRDRFPCDEHGGPLLIDPTAEAPYDHLRLTFSTGHYVALSAKGAATIAVFGLGRPALERGRAAAFVRCRSMLRDCAALLNGGDAAGAGEVRNALLVQPFADVLHGMLRHAHRPGAAVVFGAEVVGILKRWHTMAPGASAALPGARHGGDAGVAGGRAAAGEVRPPR
ncbi:HNH endonuclease [Streptomyces marincola]|uniref:HNH endonuclease n=1 Tax=Streptomyces marincola TaxID=2878388 RepID=UPI0021006482|nr:HNH endonuclease [Streptomyces marincola]